MNMILRLFLTAVTISLVTSVFAQLPPVFNSKQVSLVRSSDLTRKFLTAERIVWVSDTTGRLVLNAENILTTGIGQADLNSKGYFNLIGTRDTLPGIILDFGHEIQGGIEFVTTRGIAREGNKVRVRFGESVSETMSEIGKDGAINDHAMRDFIVTLPWLGRLEVGNSGFRFVRIDLVEPGSKVEFKEISAILNYREIPYLGSFKCSDERLNKIWMTGAYTVHLNMQDYLWDGVKRDRLVWIGDMHPEVMTINAVFGYNDVVPKSLDLIRNLTPLPGWMNGISSYSMWWILIQYDWYNYQGNLEYLKNQQQYLKNLLLLLASEIDPDGKESLDGGRFLDWPSSENKEAVHAGLQSLMVMTFEAGKKLAVILGDPKTAEICTLAIKRLRQHIPEMGGSKQAAALLSLSGLVPADKSNSESLAKGGVHKMSTFYGYYMLKARALAGDYQGAIDNIREYWGAMLDLGATTFWEDFDIEWMKDAGRIDQLPSPGKIDIHSAYGNYCYKGFRHSFCHGWASGPTSWLSENVLGVKVLEPGCRVIRIEPHLGDLQWVEGTFPTPFGIIKIRHDKMANGLVKSRINAPKGIRVVK
jgi:hypothetical protein